MVGQPGAKRLGDKFKIRTSRVQFAGVRQPNWGVAKDYPGRFAPSLSDTGVAASGAYRPRFFDEHMSSAVGAIDYVRGSGS